MHSSWQPPSTGLHDNTSRKAQEATRAARFCCLGWDFGLVRCWPFLFWTFPKWEVSQFYSRTGVTAPAHPLTRTWLFQGYSTELVLMLVETPMCTEDWPSGFLYAQNSSHLSQHTALELGEQRGRPRKPRLCFHKLHSCPLRLVHY